MPNPTRRVPIDFQAIKAKVTCFMVLDRIGWRYHFHEPRGWRGPCPLHRSHTCRSRSFSVTVQGYRCFVCGERGDCIRLYAYLAELSLYDAALAICEEFGLEVPVLPLGERR